MFLEDKADDHTVIPEHGCGEGVSMKKEKVAGIQICRPSKQCFN